MECPNCGKWLLRRRTNIHFPNPCHYLYCSSCSYRERVSKSVYDAYVGHRTIVRKNREFNPPCPRCQNPVVILKTTGKFACGHCRKGVSKAAALKDRDFVSKAHQNSKQNKSNTTGYRGVSFHIQKGKYRAAITKNGKYYNLGTFTHAEEAAIAYNLKALELFGDKAFQNTIVWSGHDAKAHTYGVRGPAIGFKTSAGVHAE